jgi:hypothetical protein
MKPRQKTATNAPCPYLLLFFLALQKTMMSLPTHSHLLQLKTKTKNTQKTKRGQ